MDKKIKAFVMDVDGTMTDGKIYMGSNGEMFKALILRMGLAFMRYYLLLVSFR